MSLFGVTRPKNEATFACFVDRRKMVSILFNESNCLCVKLPLRNEELGALRVKYNLT